MKEIMNDIFAFNFEAINIPKYTENTQNNWIKYGDNNDFPNQLIKLCNESPIHNSIIKSKVTQIIGKGFDNSDIVDKKTLEFLKKANRNESFDELLYKIVWDYVVFGGFYCSFWMSKDKKSVAEIFHIPFETIRWGKVDQFNKPSEYYYSKDWSKYRKSEYAPTQISAYSETNKEAEQMICVSDYNAGYILPLPSYIGALVSIQTDIEINYYNLAAIQNGLSVSAMVTFIGPTPTEEKAQMFKKVLQRDNTGPANAGKYLITNANNKDGVPVIQSLQNENIDKQFTELKLTTNQNILTGHRVTSKLLLGIGGEGAFGNGGELMNSFQIYESVVINPSRTIIQKFINMIQEKNNLVEIRINNSNPIEFTYSEQTLLQILTKNELREKIGMDVIEEINQDSLAVQLGVGGTNSIQLILQDTILTPEQKLPILIILFGVNEDDAKKLLNIK